jgi:hypothetical protein
MWVCLIDWQAVAGILTAVAIFSAALIASDTFNVWRRQTLFVRHSEFAESVLTNFYEFRQAIDHARGIFTSAAELDAAKAALTKHPNTEEPNDQTVAAQAMLEKLNKNTDIFEKTFSNLARTKALFGVDAQNALFEAIQAHRSFVVYVNAYANDKYTNAEFTQKIDQFLWKGFAAATGEKVDPIDHPLDRAEKELEAILLPYIRIDPQTSPTKTKTWLGGLWPIK